MTSSLHTFALNEAVTSTTMNALSIRTVIAGTAAERAALASPSAGMLWYETDTFIAQFYTGAAWIPVLGSGAWTAYTPVWSGTLGNGTLVGSYVQMGKSILWEATVTWGTTTSHAAANQTISVPVAVKNATPLRPVGLAVASATGGSLQGSGEVLFSSGTVTCVMAANATFWTNVVPFAWANGSTLLVGGSYQIA